MKIQGGGEPGREGRRQEGWKDSLAHLLREGEVFGLLGRMRSG